MAKTGDNLSTLFRSLGPDSASLQPAAAPEAEQRWPLLKALPPRRQDAPPPLTDEERGRWNRAEAPAALPRKPALSLPSLSSKLAQSLARMGGRKPAEPALPAPRAERPAPAPAPAPERQPEFKPAIEAPAPLMAALDRVAAAPEARVQAAVPEPIERDAPAGESLSGLFKRLEGGDEAAAPAPRRPSFLDRWTKR
jgi:hypothetical protein